MFGARRKETPAGGALPPTTRGEEPRSKRLSQHDAAAAVSGVVPIPTGREGRGVRTELVGATPSGTATAWSRTSLGLVLFLSTTCDGCRDLAELVRSGIGGFDVLGVLRAPVGGLPSVAIDEFVGHSGHWLIGDDPFLALDVRSAPFFCIVEEACVQLEGVAFGALHVAEHCERYLAGTVRPDAVRIDPEGR